MRCLVTGGAGFIGSNIVEALLDRGADVVVFDNLSTGKRRNIEPFIENRRCTFIEGTITDRPTCDRVCKGVDYVFHEAALVSVPLSIESPESTCDINIRGTANVFLAARDAGAKRVVFASSTSVYGNPNVFPNVETQPLNPLSPYAASKVSGEMLARAFTEVYGMPVICLRYFNVFGKRQDPSSTYAAAIPRFVTMLLRGETPTIFGDGEQTRDFVYIDNVVQANIRATVEAKPEAFGKAFNIGCGAKTSINRLYTIIAHELKSDLRPLYGPERPGEVRDSVADISAARSALGYEPAVDVEEGLKRSIAWYREQCYE